MGSNWISLVTTRIQSFIHLKKCASIDIMYYYKIGLKGTT